MKGDDMSRAVVSRVGAVAPSEDRTSVEVIGLRELQGLPPTLTVEEAARLCRIGRNAAYEAVASGHLPGMRIGRRWVVPTMRLLRLLGLGADEDSNCEAGQ
jgi:excisionase family DNA binding protein